MTSRDEEGEEMKARIAALERELDVYRQVFEASPIGITISTKEGTFLDANPSALRVFGRARSEVLGRTSIELGLLSAEQRGSLLGTPVFDLLSPEGRARAEASQPRRSPGMETGETRLICRDGQKIWVKFDSSPLVDEAGHPAGVLTVVLDLTDRWKAEERLRRSEELLHEAQELAHVGSWDLDIETNTVTRSPQLYRIYGTTEEEHGASGGMVYDFVHIRDRARVRTVIETAIARRESYSVDYQIERAGELRFIHARGRAVCDEAGNLVRMVGTVQDVTERKQVEARLTIADRMASIGTLASGVGHEINNPLTCVLSNLDLLAEELGEIFGGAPSMRIRELATLVAEAREGGERVRTIVRGLKAFSRVEDAQPALLDVRKILEVAAGMASNEIRHRARLTKQLGEVPLIEGDETRIGQVFVNLLLNAAQAIPEGNAEAHEIRLVTRTDAAGRAVIEVRDTGPGMSPEVLARVFDPFFTTKPIGVGTGLGLSICHGILAALGGQITAQSEPGKGAVFQVTLPAAGSAKVESEAPTSSAAPWKKRGRLLIVDDDAMVGKTLARILRAHDVTVLTDAREVRAHLAQGERFDLILCDLMMPEMTGMDLHAELSRTAPELIDRMIFITGGAFTPTAAEFLERVPNVRVDKPFEAKTLQALVQRLLR
jgi:PAS domain S-box-containing protein